MGSDSIRSFSVGFVVIGLTMVYLVPGSFDSLVSFLPYIGVSEDSVKSFIRYVTRHDKVNQQDEPRTTGSHTVRLFTVKELMNYNGEPNSQGLYLAILGEVFDVSKGAQHYKPGSSYAFFAGRDASRSYITGEYEEGEHETDDLSGLDDSAYEALDDWIKFYREEYTFKGKLIGRYYDEKGEPTNELKKVHAKTESARSNKWLEDKENQVFPPCNSEWSKEKGSRVWCTKKSGGIDRDWIGVPRKFYKAGKDPRCVCVKNFGPPSSKPDSKDHSDVGDLEHSSIQEYPGCSPEASSCKVDHP